MDPDDGVDISKTASSSRPKALNIAESNRDDRDDGIKRASTAPFKRQRILAESARFRGSEDTSRFNYATSPFYSDSMQDMRDAILPDPLENTIHLTAVHTVTSPTTKIVSPSLVHSLARTLSLRSTKTAEDDPLQITISSPNQFRAFSRRAYSFQKRQWFDNICCIVLCPFLMVMISFILLLVISNLSNGGGGKYQILYCSNRTSSNQQNWPIFNITSGQIYTETFTKGIPGATGPVFSVNYLSRLSLVDLTGRDPIAQLIVASVAGSIPCVQWFGANYPTSDDDVYQTTTAYSHSYSNKDTVYSAEILSGWLDVLGPTNGGIDLSNPYAKQALALLNSFVVYQSRPWSIVSVAEGVDDKLVGSAPKEANFTSVSSIPGNGSLYFKNAFSANGILDTIEPRYYVLATALPPALAGYQKVPFFDKNFTSPQALSDALYLRLSNAVHTLNTVPPVDQALYAINPTIAIAQTIFNMQNAVIDLPFTAINFQKLDNVAKNYSYLMQVGTNPVLANVQGFPTAGFRGILQQSQLSNGIMRFSNTTLAATVITQGTRAFPFIQPAQVQVPFGSIIGRILYPLGISFLLPIFTLILVKDKENKILNGLGDVTGYYVSTYILFYINYTISSIVFLGTGYAVNLDLFARTSWGLLFIILLLWGHIQISLSFVFSALFRSSSIATIGVFILTVCGVVTSFILDQVFESVTSFPNALYIWPPFVFYRVLDLLNRHATSTALAPYTFAMIKPGDVIFQSLLILAAQVVILIALAIYLTQVLPTDFGSQRPWHYPVSDLFNFFCGSNRPVTVLSLIHIQTFRRGDIGNGDETDKDKEDDDVRQERRRVSEGDYASDAPLVIQGMRKEYKSLTGKTKVAVKDATFCVENNVVFGLLGPNGAGKTSLISILTGVYAPTSGNASLAGFDIIQDPELAFRSIGVCPQFDILWSELTVEDHLYFYARLKGVTVDFEDAAVEAALDLVKMADLRIRVVKGLSGGERRRVSIAIALVSNPKVVFLDEPTTGLDPQVRRVVWDTIARARGNRAILMTTHSMEEAEVCCQTIGIMAKGRMRCLGSPTRLKHLYGCGYKLSITFTNLSRAEDLINQILPPGSKVLHAFHSNRKYGFVPDSDQLANVFDQLVSKSEMYGIKTWGVSQTTLDEIFTAIVTAEDASGQ